MKSLTGEGGIIGDSEPLKRVLEDVQKVAGTDATVLILGETGTGKELIARSIHSSSRRADKPFVKVNCPAIPSNLIESEFFGHEQGAFTGATRKREGRFAIADGGTIFLDEIGELPLDLQSKLLRVLQEGEFEPVGSSKTVKVNVRIISATNRDLIKEVKEGRFREDLYYRLNVFQIELPPLRERAEDIEKLARSFVEKFSVRDGMSLVPLSAGD
ncbi:MAG: sigma 54-interacting transcriptional regulator, partial [Myxococcales bacterium]|nr:sigma 54-interacting transcriptional regulator [Myxococcales bacterium]